MAQIRAQLKRGVLNSLARQAATAKVTLLNALNAYQDALIAGVKAGRTIEVSSGAGHMSKFRTPFLGEHFRPEDMAELTQEFVEVYSDSLGVLATGGNSSPTDAQVLATMLIDDRMQSVTRTRVDYTIINYPSRY